MVVIENPTRTTARTPDPRRNAAILLGHPLTSPALSDLLGVVPLVFATGAGAASRQSIGTGVFGGMLAATFLAIFFVPLFFVLVRTLSQRVAPRHSQAEGGP